MIGFALAAALAVASQAAEFRPPANAMVAFNDGCDWGLDGLDSLPEDVERLGWRTFEPAPGSQLAAHLEAGRAEAGGAYRLRTFSQQIGGRDIYLVLSEDRSPSGGVRMACRMLDFGAPEPVGLADLVRWAGRHPDGGIGDYGQPSWGHFWEPGLSEGHDRTEIYHVPADSPLRESRHLSGMIFSTVRTSERPQ